MTSSNEYGRHVRPGYEVRSEDGANLGHVASVGSGQFTIDRHLEPDLTLPFTAVRSVSNRCVTLTMPASMVRHGVPTTQTAAPFGRSQVHVGMDVVGANADPIGTIVEVRDRDFRVDRPQARDVYVPFDVILGVSNQHVALQIPADQVDNMDWPGI